MKSKLHSRLAPLAALFVFASALSTPLPIVRADNVSDARARVDAAGSDVEKINALYQYARALDGLNATREEQLKALEAMKQALALIAKLEANGAKIDSQSQFHYFAGYLALQLDDYAGAIRFFNDAERKNFVAENATARHKGALLFRVRGEAKWKSYDFPGALADFNRAIEIAGEKSDYAQRARLHFEMGNEDAARADWDKGDKEATNEQIAVEDAARRFALLDGGNAATAPGFPFDRKLLPFNTAIAAAPREAQPLLNRAAYLIRKGFGNDGGNAQEIAKAQRDLDYVLRLEPRSAPAFHLRALALWRLATLNRTLADAQTDEAIQRAFSRALQNDDSPVAFRLDVGDYFTARAQALLLTDLAARPAVLRNALFNYSQVLLKQPNNTLARARRIRVEMTSERPDANTLLTDSEAIARDGLNASPDTVSEAEQLRAQAQTARAQALLQNGELTQAQQALDAALQKDKSATNLRLRGQVHVLRGRYDEAITDLEASLNHARGNAQTWWWLGLAQDGKGNIVRAKSALENAIRIDARFAPQLAGTRYAASTPTAKALVMPPVTGELKPQGTALQHKDAGNALMQKGDSSGALAEYNTALLLDPSFADALNNRANVYREQGKLDLALSDLNRALELDPRHRIAWLGRADIHSALGNTAQAMTDLNNAVLHADNDDRRSAALISRAHLHRRLKDKTSAQNDLDAAQKLAGNNTERLKQIEELRAALNK